MNEEKVNFKPSDHLSGIILFIIIFCLVVFISFKQSGEIVGMKNNEKENKQSIDEKKYKSETYANYLSQLEKIKQEGKLTENKENEFATEMAEKIIKDTAFERSDRKVITLSNIFSKEKYQANIDDATLKARKVGLGKEMDIFIAQAESSELKIEEEGESLVLSDIDKEDLIKAGNGYAYFAEMVEKLITPTDYKDVANLIINNSYDIATVLKKIAVEEDPLINTVWFVRYTELVKIFYQNNQN